MKSISLLITTALFALATGTIIAPDLPDGVYHSHIDEHGVEHHIRLSGGDSKSFTPLSWTHDPGNATLSTIHNRWASADDSLEKRNCAADPSTANSIWCGCAYELDHPGCDAAVADLKNQVGPKGTLIKQGQAYYSIRGITIAYACSYKQYGAPQSLVTPTQISTGLAHITNRCGLYITGTYASKYDSVLAGFDVGYMRNFAGLSQHICDDAVDDFHANCC